MTCDNCKCGDYIVRIMWPRSEYSPLVNVEIIASGNFNVLNDVLW